MADKSKRRDKPDPDPKKQAADEQKAFDDYQRALNDKIRKLKG